MRKRFGFIICAFLTIILLFTVSAMADDIASGVYDNVNWRITDAGELILGNGDVQTFANVSSRSGIRYPWASYTSQVVSVTCDGDVYGQGDLGSMFYPAYYSHFSNLKSVDFSHFYTDNVTDMSYMFRDCAQLESIDVSGFNTSKVRNMECMFYNCSSLESLDVSNFDTSNVTLMNHMFGQCSKLKSLDLNNFDTSKVTDMMYMFYNCSSLVDLNLTGWTTDNVTTIERMFTSCSKLRYLDLSGWNSSSITGYSSIFSSCGSLQEVLLGDNNIFKGSSASFGFVLPSYQGTKDGVEYTGKWIRKDKTFGPYTSDELKANYTSAMAGRWVWEEAPVEYEIHFASSDSASIGSMSNVRTLIDADYVLPKSTIKLFAHTFDHWDDGNGHTYADQGVIPASTYGKNDVVELSAVFVPVDTSVSMRDGQFTFNIQGDESALFENVVPAGTRYYVYEENLPDDWVLIQQRDSTGVIMPLSESIATFLNKYQPDIATIQFVCRKLFDEQPAEAGQFMFELWEDNALVQTKDVKEGGFVQFDVIEYDRNSVGRHKYVIKERVGTDETVLYDGHEEEIDVVVVAETDDGGVTHVTAEVDHSSGTYLDMLFQNWTKPGELTLRKSVDDLLNGHEADEFKFRIRFMQEDGLPLSEALTCMINNP